MDWRKYIIISSIALCCLFSFSLGIVMTGAIAQTNDKPSLDDSTDTNTDAQKALEELDRRENPLIIPDRPDTNDTKNTDPVTDTTTPNNNSSNEVRSTTNKTRSGVPPKFLRREGQFLLNQRAYLQKTPGGVGWKLTFLADASGLADPPMYVMPCRLLEDMEAMIGNQKDFVFIVSGQVFVYQGDNFILPTAIRVVRDRGNLNPRQ